MNRKLLESALESFLTAWENKSIDAVVDLLANYFKYYESPLDKPLTTKKQIKDLWAPVPKFEADVKLSSTTLCINNDFGFFRVQGTYKQNRKTTRIDRIFLLSIDKKGKITKFMQWRESKDEYE